MAMKFSPASSRSLVISFFFYQGLWCSILCKFQERVASNSDDFGAVRTKDLATRSLSGYCPNDWYTFEDKCYKVFGTTSSPVTSWNSALALCRSFLSNLASIHNAEEQDFLTALVMDIKSETWIGLRLSPCIFFQCRSGPEWIDNSPMNYTNWWKLNEPKRQEQCVRIMPYHYARGEWKSTSCHSLSPFICEKRKDSKLTRPGRDPSLCAEPEGWLKVKSSCYQVLYGAQNNVTWDQAESLCNSQYAANLASVKSLSVTTHLHRYLKGQQGPFWIGIQSVEKHKYTWLGREPLIYSNWGIEQPKEPSDQLYCVAVDSEGKWLVKDCNESAPFICEVREDIRIPTITPYNLNLTCPDSSPKWYDYGGKYCYIIEINEKVPADEASRRCENEGGFLASFHSIEEINVIQHYIKDNNVGLLIGLQRVNGTFAWSDGSAVDFINWYRRWSLSSHEDCIEIHPNGMWYNVACSKDYEYICSTLKVPKKEPVPFSDKQTGISGISAIATVAVLVVAVVIVGVLVVKYFFPSVAAKLSGKIRFVRMRDWTSKKPLEARSNERNRSPVVQVEF